MPTATRRAEHHSVPATEHLDVLIVGAGISGIGAAHHLQKAFPQRSYAILEARESLGGTWDLFRYPGVRSDSDMYTLGYRFRPWTGDAALAAGGDILRYLQDTAHEAGIDRRIRYGHRVLRAEWCSQDARWTLDAIRGDGEPVALTCSFLLMCSGYYRYDHGHTPHFEGAEDFKGRIVHPQHWPADLDHSGKRVVVIGSGATAVTLVPAMSEQAAHVTMLQRSPTYIAPVPGRDAIAGALRRVLGERLAAVITRWKNVGFQTAVYRVSRRRPQLVRRIVRRAQRRRLPQDFDIDTHLTPSYDPWDQRMCWVPDGDMFAAIRAGRASIVTDHVARFTEGGIELRSGRTLDADVIVTATGLELLAFGGIELHVDGLEVVLPDTTAYKGTMLSGVPNFAFTIGYTNSSWTLKADLVSQYVCRVLAHMDCEGHAVCVPVGDPDLGRRPIFDLAAGYIQRAADQLPRSGDRKPWRMGKSYVHDLVTLRHGRIADGVLRFGAASPAPVQQAPATDAARTPVAA